MATIYKHSQESLVDSVITFGLTEEYCPESYGQADGVLDTSLVRLTSARGSNVWEASMVDGCTVTTYNQVIEVLSNYFQIQNDTP